MCIPFSSDTEFPGFDPGLPQFRGQRVTGATKRANTDPEFLCVQSGGEIDDHPFRPGPAEGGYQLEDSQ